MEITGVELLNGRTPARGSVAGGTVIKITGTDLLQAEIYSDGTNNYRGQPYLKFDRTKLQYINTGIIPEKNTTKIFVDYKRDEIFDYTNGQYDFLYTTNSPWNNSSQSAFCISKQTASPQYRNLIALFGNNPNTISGSYIDNYIDNERHTSLLDFTNNTFSIDNQIVSINKTYFNPTSQLMLGRGTVNSIQYYTQFFNGYIYGMTIEQNGTPVRDMVPAFNISTGDSGLFDKINNVFYKNSNNTEQFTVSYADVVLDFAGNISRCKVVSDTDTEIICKTSKHAKGLVGLKVDNGVENATFENAFEFVPCLAQKTADGYRPLKMKRAGGDLEVLQKNS